MITLDDREGLREYLGFDEFTRLTQCIFLALARNPAGQIFEWHNPLLDHYVVYDVSEARKLAHRDGDISHIEAEYARSNRELDEDYINAMSPRRALDPLVAVYYGNNGKLIIDGHHRAEKARRMGLTMLTVHVVPEHLTDRVLVFQNKDISGDSIYG